MKNIKQILTLALFLVLVIVVVVFQDKDEMYEHQYTQDSCVLNNMQCIIGSGSAAFKVKFNQDPIAETELLISFDIPANIVIEKAWVEGINMYMGKTPIVFENSNDLGEGLTFLGSCSLAHMKWQMMIQVKNKKTEDTFVYSVFFDTFRT